MPDPIDWALAERIAVRIAGTDPFARSYHAQSLATDFAELTTQAEALVSAETGLVSTEGAARAQVAGRPEWIAANVASFRRLLRPITEKLGSKMAESPLIAPAGRAFAAAEVGTLLGWMSQRVLGQYDLLVDPADSGPQDVVYYVGPNILALEKRFAFPPREFRLWLALHEVTHRMQFTGVPWMKPHFLGLVEQSMSMLDPDPGRFVAALRHGVSEWRAGNNPLREGGLAVLFASPEQKVALDSVSGLMSLLEGHGDVTMDRAGAHLLPSAERFARVLRDRRAAPTGRLTKLMRELVGLEAKLRQYEDGERFIGVVERELGPRAVDLVWEDPSRLPSGAEIRDPQAWIRRIAPRLGATASA